MCETCRSAGVASPTRRGFLTAAGVVALAGSVAPAFAQQTAAPLGGDQALKRLMEGNARYVAGQLNERDFSAGRAARATSQAPFASIVGCADSRVAPELAFDQGPGDLFVTRVAGNFVNDDGLASLEFGAAILGSQLIMVLGHTRCGAITATIDVVKNGTVLPGHLPALATAIRPAVEAARKDAPADLLEAATIANVKLNVERLKTASPILSERLKQGKLLVVGAVYELATGKVALV